MEITRTPEGLVRRKIRLADGRSLEFYNLPGEEQPLNPDADVPVDAGTVESPTAEAEVKNV